MICLESLILRDSGTQSSFGTWFVLRWSEPRKAKSARNPLAILRSLQQVVAMVVNTDSSNHEAKQEADRDPKRLSERDSLLCVQAPLYIILTLFGFHLMGVAFDLGSPVSFKWNSLLTTSFSKYGFGLKCCRKNKRGKCIFKWDEK